MSAPKVQTKTINPAKVHLAIENNSVDKRVGMFAFSSGDSTWVVHQIVAKKVTYSDYSHGWVDVPDTLCGIHGAFAMAEKVCKANVSKPGSGRNNWFTNEPVDCPQCIALAQ